MPPVCISVINMKGGTGKTTVTALLAQYAAANGLDALAIDLDPQANLSQALMASSEDENAYQLFLDSSSPSIVEVFLGYLPPTLSQPAPTPLNIGDAVYGCNPNLELIPSRFDFADSLVSAIRFDPMRLARVIADQFAGKDLILIDCAPTESIFTRAAYHASRYVLVPVRPEFLATIGFPLLSESLDNFRYSNRSHEIDVMGVVVNNATYLGSNMGGPERQASMQDIKNQADYNGWRIFGNHLAYSREFPKFMRGEFSRRGNAWDSFNKFAKEFFDSPQLSDLGI